MAQNKVMKLWTAIVTAFIALCTTLGLVTTTATAAPATPRTGTTHAGAPANEALPTVCPWAWAVHVRSLPPTMKQRIHAEAHGKSPSCRHRPPTETDEATEADNPLHDPAEPLAAPLRR